MKFPFGKTISTHIHLGSGASFDWTRLILIGFIVSFLVALIEVTNRLLLKLGYY